MKKLFLILLAFGLVSFASAQIALPFTPATNDSLVGAVTKYCSLSKAITQQYSGCIEVYITASVGANDSTHITLQGSYNNSTWYDIDISAALLTGSTAARSGQKYLAIGDTSGGFLLNPTWYFNMPYYRLKVQHYVAATSIKVTRANIYLKK